MLRVDGPGEPRASAKRRGDRTRVLVGGAVAWVAYSIVLGLIYTRIPPNPDQAIFDYMGWVVEQGGRIYLDVTEHNFPGEAWLHTVSTWLFGNHIWSYRLFDYLCMLGGAAMLVVLLATEVGFARAWVVAPLYQAMYVTSGAWMAGQRDVIAAHMLLALALVYRARMLGGSRLWLAAFGPIIVYTVLTRPPYASFPVFLVLIDLATAKASSRSFRTVLADAGLAFASSIVALGLILLAAWQRGQLAAFYEDAIRYNVEHYGRGTYGATTLQFLGMLESWHWYAAFSIAGSVLWWKHAKDRRVWAIPAALGTTAIVSAYTQLKGFGYHLAGLLPVMAIFVSYLLVWAASRVRRFNEYDRLALAGVLATVAILGLGSKFVRGLGSELAWLVGQRTGREALAARATELSDTTYADVVDASSYLKDSVDTGERVLVWHRLVHVNFLAERRSATRFITVNMLRHATSPTYSARWTQEVAGEFSRDPPEAIVVAARGEAEDEGFWSDAPPSAPLRFIREQVATRYELARSFGKLQVYRLREGR
jgi:hypothetical protein